MVGYPGVCQEGVQGYDFRTKRWRVDEATATQEIYDHQLLDRFLFTVKTLAMFYLQK